MAITNPRRFKGSLFYEQEDVFFSKLEKCTGPLRFCAHEMVECIEKLAWQSKELDALKDAYHQIESTPVKDLDHRIDAIKNEFLNVNFNVDSTHSTAMNNADFAMYFDKKNHFNAEVNALIKKAIEIAA